MAHCYCSNQIIQYLYKELPLLEYLETDYAIQSDREWQDTYHNLKKAYLELPRVQFFPSRKIVNSVLEYSTESMA